MSTLAISSPQFNANRLLKERYWRNFMIGLLFAVSFHAALILYGPDYVLRKHADRQIFYLESEDVPEVKVEISHPPTVSAPAVPVPTDDASIPLDATIENTDFNPYAPPAPPPPPPQQAIATYSEESPIFIAYEEPPEVITRVKPDYPELAREAGIEGKVYLNVYVDESGKVKKAVVMKGVPNTGLDEAALTAIEQWVYKPATQRGKPIGVWISQVVKFEIAE